MTPDTGYIRELRKFVAPEIVFGRGGRRLAGRYARNLGGRRTLVVSDPGIVRAGWTAGTISALEEEGVPCVLFTGLSPNPKAEEVMAGAAVFADEGCNAIVATGGGSSIDCAKGIGIVSTNGGHILDYEGVDRVDAPMPPLICIPTTAGSSADVSQFVIIADRSRRIKIAIISKAVVPDVSLVDPETTTTLSPDLSAATGMDALTHAVEAYVSNAHSPLTDLHALEAIRCVSSGLVASLRDPGDMELRTRMMLGSLHAGLAFSNAILGTVHAMAHSLGGFMDLPHGECNALLLEHVTLFNFEAAGDRYRRVGMAMGADLAGAGPEEAREAIVGAMRRLRIGVGITHTLRDIGVTPADIHDLAEKAMRDPCMATNPRRPSLRDIEAIFEAAL